MRARVRSPITTASGARAARSQTASSASRRPTGGVPLRAPRRQPLPPAGQGEPTAPLPQHGPQHAGPVPTEHLVARVPGDQAPAGGVLREQDRIAQPGREGRAAVLTQDGSRQRPDQVQLGGDVTALPPEAQARPAQMCDYELLPMRLVGRRITGVPEREGSRRARSSRAARSAAAASSSEESRPPGERHHARWALQRRAQRVPQGVCRIGLDMHGPRE